MNSNDLRAGIRKSISHLRESYQRADDLVAACERHGLSHYLDLAYSDPADKAALTAANEELVARMERGEALIRAKKERGEDTTTVEDKWLALMNCYCECAEATFRE